MNTDVDDGGTGPQIWRISQIFLWLMNFAAWADTLSAMIDLRSDTITQPTDAMRRAIAEAVVGDDVFGDDPTVKELERRTAELLGKSEALFMPSGTMSNQVAVRTHTEPGDEILIEG